MSSEKIHPEHLGRPAFVYVRQSTFDQIRHHHESRRRQYDLQGHARTLGWHEVVVIDEDLGKSGATAVGRTGLQRLVAEVSLGLELFDARIEERTRPLAGELERLDTITGVARRSAEQILAELGADMRRFPTAAHAASWTGICPGNNESAGKRKSGKTRKGNRWLRATLTECARGAVRAQDTYLAAQYHRIARRRGDKKVIVAVGHSILLPRGTFSGTAEPTRTSDATTSTDSTGPTHPVPHPPAGEPGRRRA
jgi:transposase